MAIRMTRTPTLLLLVTLLLASCGEEPAPIHEIVVPSPADGGGMVVGPDGPGEKISVEEHRSRAAATEKEWDTYCRGLLGSFRARLYDPVRDDQLERVDATLTVTAHSRRGADSPRETRTGSYSMTFDRALPLERQIVFTAISGHEDLVDLVGPHLLDSVHRYCQIAVRGPYHFVVDYLPPIPLVHVRSNDGKDRVVKCPQHQTDLGCSYRVNDQDLVTIRGKVTDAAKQIDYFAWDPYREGSRQRLAKTWVYAAEDTTEFEYDDSRGPALLSRATRRRGEASFVVEFEYQRVDVVPR